MRRTSAWRSKKRSGSKLFGSFLARKKRSKGALKKKQTGFFSKKSKTLSKSSIGSSIFVSLEKRLAIEINANESSFDRPDVSISIA